MLQEQPVYSTAHGFLFSLFITAFFLAIHYGSFIEELPRVNSNLRKFMSQCMIWSSLKPLSEICRFFTCFLICVNIRWISPSISLPSKTSVIKLLNGICTPMLLLPVWPLISCRPSTSSGSNVIANFTGFFHKEYASSYSQGHNYLCRLHFP